MKTRSYLVFGLMLLTVSFAGCQTVPIQDGRLPPVQNLGELTVGNSTKEDVVRLLGVPRGLGKTLHKPNTEFRDIIYYEYVLLKDDDIGLKLLLVYLKDDVYDGHLWFGANQFIERQL